MNLRKRLLEKSRLYAILDKKTLKRRGKDIFALASKIKNSGVGLVQFRDKESDRQEVLRVAIALSRLFLKTKTLFIINDYLEIAKIVDSDGIHLGQQDVPPGIARQVLGKDKIIGVSTHSLKQAITAQENGADYISIGPIFPTPTKPEYQPIGLNLIKRCARLIKIPLFAIGGINEENIEEVLEAGAKRVAVCRAILT